MNNTVPTPAASEQQAGRPFFTAKLQPDADGGTVPLVFLNVDQDRDLNTSGCTLAAAEQAEAMATTLRALAEEQRHAEGGDEPIPFTLTDAARTWTFERWHGEGQQTETCPTWCASDHRSEIDRPIPAEDVWHQLDMADTGIRLPVEVARDEFEDMRVLDVTLSMVPHSDDPKRRLPFVEVELLEEFRVSRMGPDEFAVLIEKLAGRLEDLRAMHTRLVQARAEWRERQQ